MGYVQTNLDFMGSKWIGVKLLNIPSLVLAWLQCSLRGTRCVELGTLFVMSCCYIDHWEIHQVIALLRLAGTSEGQLSNTSSPAGPSIAPCPGPCPRGFWASSRSEDPQPLWTAESPTQLNVFWCSDGSSWVPMCAHCLLSCQLWRVRWRDWDEHFCSAQDLP